jgi:hypothetical protein
MFVGNGCIFFPSHSGTRYTIYHDGHAALRFLNPLNTYRIHIGVSQRKVAIYPTHTNSTCYTLVAVGGNSIR